MTTLPDQLTIAKTIPAKVHDSYGSALVGGNDVDENERWILGVGLHDASGDRDLEGLVESDTFEFAGATWQVTKIYEPNTSPRGIVAELTRITEPEG